MAEDYYKLLGVTRNANKDELKKVFRKLAMKYHPDKNKDNKASEEKFKKINEAYAVLSNDEKRKQYDMFGAEGFQRKFSQEDIFRGFDFKDVFSEFGMGDIFGRQGGFSQGHHNHAPQNAETELRITLEDAVYGAKKRVSLDTGRGTEKIDISVPVGVEDGQKLRIRGKGPAGPMGGQRGDLMCKLSVMPHPIFTRKGKDLVMEKELKLTDMVLGGKIRIINLDNKEIELKVPPHSKNNSMLRIKGKGIPGTRGATDGNLLVRLQAKLPTSLDENQKKFFEELAKTGV